VIQRMTRTEWASLLIGMGLGMDDAEELALVIRKWLKANVKRGKRP